MNLTKNIFLENFKINKKKNKKTSKKIKLLLSQVLKKENEIVKSLGKSYEYSFNKSNYLKLKKFNSINLIGIGGSILGAKSIYTFLSNKIKKKFFFFDKFVNKKEIIKKKKLNLIISKSGNTLETIVNSNIIINKKDHNIFISETKNSYLTNLANKLKAEIISHNNFIGGRYSVLSEVGMLPAKLMGLNINKFKRLNYLIKNKNFKNSLIAGVSNILAFTNKNKNNSIILNYDSNSKDLLKWYQQLVAESLGKKNKGILPIISSMPQDNHSLMQLYLDGPKNNFFTFFYVADEDFQKINNDQLLKTHSYLRNKNICDIRFAQYVATQKVFKKKNIPFRNFFIKKRSEETLGELFSYFILETILLGSAMKLNPYDQPAVELIKIDTKKILTTI